MSRVANGAAKPIVRVPATGYSSGAVLRLPLGVAERRALLLLGDALMLTISAVASSATWAWLQQHTPVTFRLLQEQRYSLAAFGAAWLVLLATTGCYDVPFATYARGVTRRLLAAALALVTVYALIFFAFSRPPALLHRISPALGGLPLLRAQPILYIVFALITEMAWRTGYSGIVRGARFQRRALIVGAGWAGRTIVDVLVGYGDGSYHVLGFVDDDVNKQGAIISWWRQKDASHPLPVLGDRHSLRELITQLGVSTLILAITRELNGELLPVLLDCLELGVDIVPMPVLYEELTSRVPVEHVGGNWEVAMPIQHPGTGALWPMIKRLIDLAFGAVGVILTGTLFPFVALAIYLESPGPVLYHQKRVGRGGRLFTLHKFRSMTPDAEQDGPRWATARDPRVTRVGRFLRRTHLDELPQFYNILRGEMSLVGPRPERPEFVAGLADEIPFFRIRHAVRPGLTGWAQVQQGYGASQEDALLKLQYDLFYIKHQSLWLDIVILLKTAAAVLRLQGR